MPDRGNRPDLAQMGDQLFSARLFRSKRYDADIAAGKLVELIEFLYIGMKNIFRRLRACAMRSGWVIFRGQRGRMDNMSMRHRTDVRAERKTGLRKLG